VTTYFEAPALAPPDPELVPGHEIRARCVECRSWVIVGGYVDDLDPDDYTCLECRVRESGAKW
jgi:hypothetical protein